MKNAFWHLQLIKTKIVSIKEVANIKKSKSEKKIKQQ